MRNSITFQPLPFEWGLRLKGIFFKLADLLLLALNHLHLVCK